MSSCVWERSVKESLFNPYEYGAQDQFVREAKNILLAFYQALNKEEFEYTIDDNSRQKAVWLLHMDALDSLQDCLYFLTIKRHRSSFKQFRDIKETLDLAAYFFYDSRESKNELEKWYRDKIVPHRKYRDFLKKISGIEFAEYHAKLYSFLSKFNHRSYNSLLQDYILKKRKLLVHDAINLTYSEESTDGTSLVTPKTISFGYTLLADFILIFSQASMEHSLCDQKQVKEIWINAMESERVPPRFATLDDYKQKIKEVDTKIPKK